MTERNEIRIKCAKIAIENGSKHGFTKDACLDVAKKIYDFVVEKDKPMGPDKPPTGSVS